MWARLFLTAGIVAFTIGSASGQTGTADGVAALARGDYQRAVEILKPLAEDWRTDDTAAQFFMAGLYRPAAAYPPTRCARARCTCARRVITTVCSARKLPC